VHDVDIAAADGCARDLDNRVVVVHDLGLACLNCVLLSYCS
jgi:hypothetical protein